MLSLARVFRISAVSPRKAATCQRRAWALGDTESTRVSKASPRGHPRNRPVPAAISLRCSIAGA